MIFSRKILKMMTLLEKLTLRHWWGRVIKFFQARVLIGSLRLVSVDPILYVDPPYLGKLVSNSLSGVLSEN
jgi:hypothetical protein